MEKEKYIYSSRTFEGFCKDNNLGKEEGLKVILTELDRLMQEKARRDLGFCPRVDLRSGLQKTWHWLESGEIEEVIGGAKAYG